MARRHPRPIPTILTTLMLALAGVVHAAPVSSDLAVAALGGGCRPTGIQPALLDMLTLINPEWAPVLDGGTVPSTPILVHGTVEEMHGDLSGDFPTTHLRADVNEFIRLDAADEGFLATGNVEEDGRLHLEWEAGVYPAFAWAGVGDRVVALGRWIFDCGHPGAEPGQCSASSNVACVTDADCRPPLCAACGALETCTGVHFGYSAELHPPQAKATIRQGRGAVLSRKPGASGLPATIADVYVSPDGGGAGDQCILTHRDPDAALLAVECFPLAQSVAPLAQTDFVFDLPLPAKPPRGKLRMRILPGPTPGGVAPRVRLKRRLRDSPPHVEVRVRMTKPVRGQLPTGFAGRIVAGWHTSPTPLTHVRITIDDIQIDNALQPAVPSIPRTCSVSDTPCVVTADCPGGEQCFGAGPVKAWMMQAAVNGEWQEFHDLQVVDTAATVGQALVWDQYLRSDDAVRLLVDGRSQECINTMYGRSLAFGLAQLGFSKGVACLATEARNPGQIDITYPGPDFGAGAGGTPAYATVSSGGAGGHCSTNTALLCTLDRDCPSGETCVTTGGAYTLHYRIERLPS